MVKGHQMNVFLLFLYFRTLFFINYFRPLKWTATHIQDLRIMEHNFKILEQLDLSIKQRPI
jgi:hypothetical protein